MIHYHGTPITPRERLYELAGRSFCVSFAEPRDVDVCHEIGESVMLDNGAYSIWRAGRGAVNVGCYAEWVAPWLEYKTTWCVIPDIIDGDAEANDALLASWELPGAPVWHMHDPIDRLQRLCRAYERVCIGSSGEYAKLGDDRWHARMRDAMDAICTDGVPPCWLHMLRGLCMAGSAYPFASADSTNIARNHARQRRLGESIPDMAQRIDALQCPSRWAA